MENASKALIIAGSIIIAIVLISLGVFVLNGATESVKSGADMSATEVQAFNSKFLAYEGDKVSGANARALYQLIKSHNVQNSEDFSKQVNLTIGKGPAKDGTPQSDKAATMDPNTLKAGNTYKVTFGYDDTMGTGRIVNCDITQVTKAAGGGGGGE